MHGFVEVHSLVCFVFLVKEHGKWNFSIWPAMVDDQRLDMGKQCAAKIDRCTSILVP